MQAPGPDEVRIKMGASGVCHSDVSVANGTIPLPTPIVLGHEGAGVVTEVGEGVTRVAVGDHVVLSFVPNCQECYYCHRGQGYLCEKSAMQAAGGMLDGTTRLSSPDGPLFQMACWARSPKKPIVPEISIVKIPDDVPLKIAALIGCGVLTGVGAALNTADIRPGDSVGGHRLRRRGPQRDPGGQDRRRRAASSPSTCSSRSWPWPSSSAPPT